MTIRRSRYIHGFYNNASRTGFRVAPNSWGRTVLIAALAEYGARRLDADQGLARIFLAGFKAIEIAFRLREERDGSDKKDRR